MALPSKIFLVGLPASGKSTLGKRLANLMRYPFIDLDVILESQEGHKISDIIRDNGEDHFRMVEHYALKNAIERTKKFVMATGGGTPCFHENMELINQSGTSVYLKTNLNKVVERLLKDRNRPLVLSNNADAMHSEIAELLEQRALFYELAHFVTEKTSPDEVLRLFKS